VCRSCRQPVAVAAISDAEGDQVVRYRCREHTTEQWVCYRADDRWLRLAGQ
jgi:hypothetical protein